MRQVASALLLLTSFPARSHSDFISFRETLGELSTIDAPAAIRFAPANDRSLLITRNEAA